MRQWWQKFFIPVTADIMFAPRAKQAKGEALQVLKKTKPKKNSKVLDLACGTGRHAFVFAAKGFDVTGFDLSPHYISEARKAAKRSKGKIRFIRGDMKNLKKHFKPEQFDLVTSLFNSFGYFDKRSDDSRMLKEVFRVLTPGGAFVINTLNRQGVEKVIRKPVKINREPVKKLFVTDAVIFDRKKGRTHATWTIADARGKKLKTYKLEFGQNVYSHKELTDLLKGAGFKIETAWGLLEGKKLDPKTSWHQTIVARKV